MLPICHQKYYSPKQSGNKSFEEPFNYHLKHYFLYLLNKSDVILGTGANCSIVHNRNLFTNLASCNPVIFDGLSGSINITQKSLLGSICEAYYHKDIIANILSCSAIRNEGHTLEYENESDSFSLSCSYGQFVFTRRDNGHYVCRRDNGHYVSNLGPSNVFVSTVSDLESKYTK